MHRRHAQHAQLQLVVPIGRAGIPFGHAWRHHLGANIPHHVRRGVGPHDLTLAGHEQLCAWQPQGRPTGQPLGVGVALYQRVRPITQGGSNQGSKDELLCQLVDHREPASIIIGRQRRYGDHVVRMADGINLSRDRVSRAEQEPYFLRPLALVAQDARA